MKRLLMLTVVIAVTVVTTGCGCNSWFRRGPQCETCPSGGAGPYSAAPMSAMPDATYVPSPGPG